MSDDNETPTKDTADNEFVLNTSPGQLQDVTMDNTYALGYRSPCLSLQHAGSTSPGQGRSVREFEEQMASLRKENFNLKLRIYFLEEKIPGYSSSNTDGHESLLKQYVDLKVDIEVLRTELQEKQSLLCEAAKAMELMEQQQKETEQKSNAIIEELNQRIQFLEMENKQLEKSTNQRQMNEIMGRTDITGDIDTIQKVRELEGCLKQHEDNAEELTHKIKEMENVIALKDEELNELNEKVKQVMFQNSELQEQLDIKEKEVANSECSRLRKELYEHKSQLADKMCLLEECEGKLKEKTTANENACKVIQKLFKETKKQQDEIDRFKKMSSIPNTSQIKEDTYGNNSTALCRSLTDLEDARIVKSKLEEVIVEKDAEIERLKLDTKNKRSNLLTLINDEICRKERQIENLTNILKRLSPQTFFASCSPTRDINQLQQSFTETEYSEAIDCNKSMQKKLDLLMHRLKHMTESSSDEIIQQLQMEVNAAREEADKAHQWRKDACVVLTERLEELAGFLDSLLKHKDVLGALAADRSREMRKAIDRSLDISRNLSMSLSMTGVSMTEHSLAQLSNITGLLDISTENKETRLCTMHTKTMKEQKQLIEKQQIEIKSLKKEMGRRKSIEGLKKERRSLPPNLENHSESEAWSEPDRSVSFARMGLQKSPGFSHKNQNGEEKQSMSSESELDLKSKSKAHEKINQLENIISIRDDRLLDMQCELVEADNRLKQENLRVHEIDYQLQECKKVNEVLKTEINNYKSQLQHHDEQFESERDNLRAALNNKTAVIERIQEDRDKLIVEVRVAEMKIDTLKKDIDELKQKHERNLEKVIEQEKMKLDQLQKEMVSHTEQKLKEQEEKHRSYLARDWISRVVYDEIKCELELAYKKYKEAQGTIEYLQENETELNKRLIDNEKGTRHLKKSLDDATLQASKAVLDRTKVLNDKIQLEQKVQDLIQKLESTEQERNDLSVRLTQLEKSNAVLQSNLLNSSNGHYKLSKKSTSNGSDVSQSGYTSEDVPLPGAQPRVQRLDNSSPDLGIESDAGRASSVETGTQNRLLKSIENLRSADNDLEDEKWKLQNNGNENDGVNNNEPITHDCAKAEKEIVDLRKKLARTKRSLEDTAKKLRTSNLRKEQIERDIRQQIVKTNSVLKTVRTNMESELEQHKKE